MGLEDRKAELRKEIERKARYLESLEAMPNFDELANGSIVAMGVTYGASSPYPVVALRNGDLWYATGSKSPNGVSSDALAEWLVSQGRHLRTAEVVAEFVTTPVPAFEIGKAMAETIALWNNRPRGPEWKNLSHERNYEVK